MCPPTHLDLLTVTHKMLRKCDDRVSEEEQVKNATEKYLEIRIPTVQRGPAHHWLLQTGGVPFAVPARWPYNIFRNVEDIFWP